MSGQLTDAQSITAQTAELDVAQQPVAIQDPSKVAWTINDPTIATLTVDPATGIATFKALKPGTTGVGVTDGSTGLSAQDTLVVTAGPATSLQIQFGVPS